MDASMEKVFEIYIQTTPERLWEAITDNDIRAKYWFGTRVEGDYRPGAHITMLAGDPAAALGEREVVEVEPPHRLVYTMTALWSEEVAAQGRTRVTLTIDPVEDSCRLLVVHDHLRAGANAQIFGGWPMILSGLKTWLESGQLLTTPGSLLYT